MPPYRLSVNGASRTVDVPGEMPLLWALRDTLMGTDPTRRGCGMALCGARTTLLESESPRRSVTPVSAGGIAAAALLVRNPDPPGDDIDQAMPNIRRCGTYQRARRAVQRAAREV